MYLTYDTETFDKDERLIYDLGFVIHNANGGIVHTDRFLIREIFDNSEIMNKAFYCQNIPFYLDLLAQGKIRKLHFTEALRLLQDVVREYKVDTITAYNLLFDLHAFYDTTKYITTGVRKSRDENGEVIQDKRPKDGNFYPFVKNFVNKEIFCKELKFLDLYAMTVVKLLTQADYIHQVKKHEWYTKSGNPQTGAEFAYRFVSSNPKFIETHTALEDALIEVELFKACQAINDGYNEEIIFSPYHKVVRAFKEIYGNPKQYAKIPA